MRVKQRATIVAIGSYWVYSAVSTRLIHLNRLADLDTLRAVVDIEISPLRISLVTLETEIRFQTGADTDDHKPPQGTLPMQAVVCAASICNRKKCAKTWVILVVSISSAPNLHTTNPNDSESSVRWFWTPTLYTTWSRTCSGFSHQHGQHLFVSKSDMSRFCQTRWSDGPFVCALSAQTGA